MPAPERNSQRLFLALWPDPPTQDAIASHARLWTWPETCTRYKPADWHVTLHFLGNVPSHRLTALAEELQLPVDACDLVLDLPQQWPGGLAVLAASRIPQQLDELHQALAGSIAGLNLPLECRAYRPHVSLARRASAAIPPMRAASVVWPVRSYALVVSTGHADERYRVLRAYPTQ